MVYVAPSRNRKNAVVTLRRESDGATATADTPARQVALEFQGYREVTAEETPKRGSDSGSSSPSA